MQPSIHNSDLRVTANHSQRKLCVKSQFSQEWPRHSVDTRNLDHTTSFHFQPMAQNGRNIELLQLWLIYPTVSFLATVLSYSILPTQQTNQSGMARGNDGNPNLQNGGTETQLSNLIWITQQQAVQHKTTVGEALEEAKSTNASLTWQDHHVRVVLTSAQWHRWHHHITCWRYFSDGTARPLCAGI